MDTFCKTKNRIFETLGKESEDQWNGPFYFVVGADPQLGLIEYLFHDNLDGGWEEELEMTKKAVQAVNKMVPKPKFFVMLGDFVNDSPGEKNRNAQISDIVECFSELDPDIPLICVCGNHDIGRAPTESAIENYRNTFSDDYFSFWCAGVKCIVINTQYYEDSSKVPDIALEQEKWLELELDDIKANKYQHVIVFQHIPWFIRNPDEVEEHFNFERKIRFKMLEKFHKAGVSAIFCGHCHINAGGFYKNMELVITTAIGAQFANDVPGLRIVKVFEDSIKHEFYPMDELPTEVKV